MEGIHFIANFYGCLDSRILLDEKLFERKAEYIIKRAGLHIVGKCFYKFPNAGFTGVFIISESHVSIHTWPEKKNSLQLDIFTCNATANNDEKARQVFEDLKNLLKPRTMKARVLKR